MFHCIFHSGAPPYGHRRARAFQGNVSGGYPWWNEQRGRGGGGGGYMRGGPPMVCA